MASLALTGCGRDSASEDGGPGQSEATGDGPAEGTIEVWAMGTEGEELGAFVKDFESENPDAKVKVTAVPWEAAHDKLSNAIAAGETPGESVEEVAARAARVVRRAVEAMASGDVVLVAHGHLLRVLASVFLQREPRFGAHLLLDAGAVSVLEYEKELPAVRMWNRPA